MKDFITIVTHDGVFHADDVMAVAIMSLLSGGQTVVRTRDPEVINAADIVIDVGGVDDPSRDRYDHHQRGFAQVGTAKMPRSAAGLVWASVGLDIAQYDEAWRRVDAELISAVDAVDNGVKASTPEGPDAGGHPIPRFSFSAAISALNPVGEGVTPRQRDEAFEGAVRFARQVLLGLVQRVWDEIVSEKRVERAMLAQVGDRVLVLERFEAGAADRLADQPDGKGFLFQVYPDARGTWMVQQVALLPGSFAGRRPLPEAWAGLRDAALAAITGVPDAVFCHNGRFIAGAKTRQGALRLAELALNPDLNPEP